MTPPQTTKKALAPVVPQVNCLWPFLTAQAPPHTQCRPSMPLTLFELQMGQLVAGGEPRALCCHPAPVPG